LGKNHRNKDHSTDPKQEKKTPLFKTFDDIRDGTFEKSI